MAHEHTHYRPAQGAYPSAQLRHRTGTLYDAGTPERSEAQRQVKLAAEQLKRATLREAAQWNGDFITTRQDRYSGLEQAIRIAADERDAENMLHDLLNKTSEYLEKRMRLSVQLPDFSRRQVKSLLDVESLLRGSVKPAKYADDPRFVRELRDAIAEIALFTVRSGPYVRSAPLIPPPGETAASLRISHADYGKAWEEYQRHQLGHRALFRPHG